MSDEPVIDSPAPAPSNVGIPVLPLRDVVVYPHMVIPLFVGREKSIQALDVAMRGDKRIARLFPNYKDMEIEFFRNTGIFPIMHVNVVRQEIIDKYPWVATNLVKAFDEAKALAYRHVANPRSIPLAWVRTAWEEQLDVLGPDPWQYGLGEANRKNVQTVLRYCHQQGLISRMMPLGELFADTDLGDAGGGAENI